ncbi:MAG: ATP-binding protein, partial [Armatimonadetes bacterium]|nr:ATP-binding protein [Armatimonadota bacterium]
MRHFNTAGPCRADLHYMIPAAQRVVGVRRLVEQQAYFVLHAPRQSGKTTAMMEVAHDLNDAGRFASLVVSAEVGAAFADDPGTAERAILESWRLSARAFLRPEDRPPEWPDAPEGSRILAALESWRRAIARPLALFIDEIDALADEALISVLRQLRAG